MKEVKIQKSKKRFLFVLLGVLPFLWQGYELINATPNLNYPSLKISIGIIAILFWGGMIIWMIITTIKQPYVLVLNKTGLISFTDNNKDLLLNWEAIEEVKLFRKDGKEIIGIRVDENFKEEIKRKSIHFQKLIKKNQTQFDFPIIIRPKSVNLLGEDLNELIQDNMLKLR